MKRATPQQIAELIGKRGQRQPLDSARLTEPRIELIHERLRALLKVVQLEANGAPIEVDGFRLRDPAHWRTRVASPLSELWHISTACNMRCPFCYEEGDPQGASVFNEPAEMVTLDEIETRLKHRDGRTSMGVFQPMTYINEMFCNPSAMDIIERLREAAPDEVLSFVTNGTYLTEDVVSRLARLKPVFFNFSVNSLDPAIRTRILRDMQPETAITSLELLRRYGIPYMGSVVCWPTIPWTDIRNTVLELDRHGCAVIRFSLSAYSKHLKGKGFVREDFWAAGRSVAMELMREVDTPIKVEPYHYLDPSYLPNVAGVIKDSPAYRAGIRSGDRLTVVDRLPVLTSNQALGRLAVAAARSKTVVIRYLRHGDGDEIEAVLDDHGPFAYPYGDMLGFKGFEWGLILVDNIKFSYLKDMRALMDRHSAKRVLLCSSELMRPIAIEMIERSELFADCTISVEVPPNVFFGGTIVLGDLLVVDDFVRFLNERSRTGPPFDLVVIPSSPFSRGEWQRDLAGIPFRDIARRTGLTIEMLDCRPLNG